MCRSIRSTTPAALSPPRERRFRSGNGPFAVLVDPADQFLYVANMNAQHGRGVLDRPASTGLATVISGSPYAVGTKPTSMKTDPGGNFLYVTDYASAEVAAFSIEAGAGTFAAIVGSPFSAGAGPVSIAIDPTGTLAYVANETGDSISAYSINSEHRDARGDLGFTHCDRVERRIGGGGSGRPISLRGECHEQERFQQLFDYALERCRERGVDRRRRKLSAERRDRSGGSIRLRRERALQ